MGSLLLLFLIFIAVIYTLWRVLGREHNENERTERKSYKEHDVLIEKIQKPVEDSVFDRDAFLEKAHEVAMRVGKARHENNIDLIKSLVTNNFDLQSVPLYSEEGPISSFLEKREDKGDYLNITVLFSFSSCPENKHHEIYESRWIFMQPKKSESPAWFLSHVV